MPLSQLNAQVWGFDIEVAGLYLLIKCHVGSIIGIIMVVRQAPLELLQVRE